MASSLIYLFLFGLTVFVFVRIYDSTRPKTNKKQPPSPPTLPIIGNLHQLGYLVHRSLHSLSRRYGPDFMLLHMGSVPTLVVSSPEAAREIMQTQDLQFSSRPPKTRFEVLFYGAKEVAAAPYGERWKQTKKLLVQNYLTSTKVQSYNRFRDEEVVAALNKIAEHSKRNTPVNFTNLFLEYTDAVSCRATFGKKLHWDTGLKVFKDVSMVISRFYFEDIDPRLTWMDRITGRVAKVEAVAKEIDEFMESAINERLARKIDNDVVQGEPFIDSILRIHKEGTDAFAVEREVVKVLLMDAYLAGAETSSALLEWVMTELLANPRILKKLQTEVKTIVNGRQQITDDDVRQMVYLKAVVMEAIRLHPPAPVAFPRFTTKDVKVMGYDIPKGTTIIINVWGIQRDPSIWDNPDQFLPERFIGSSLSSLDYVNHNFQLLPFGGGRRSCPGRGFAMSIDEMLLANIVHNFDLKLPHDVITTDDKYMEEILGSTVHKKTPLFAFATPIASS